jgi:hypothetical protein
MTAFAIISCDSFVHVAAADGSAAVRQGKKARHVSTCAHSRCLAHRRFRCPDYYPCYSLYGGYGPSGGRVFWGGSPMRVGAADERPHRQHEYAARLRRPLRLGRLKTWHPQDLRHVKMELAA